MLGIKAAVRNKSGRNQAPTIEIKPEEGSRKTLIMVARPQNTRLKTKTLDHFPFVTMGLIQGVPLRMVVLNILATTSVRTLQIR